MAILQDRQGFMWFGTGEGLTATMATPSSSTETTRIPSLSHNFIRTVFEDDQGYLWVAAAYPGINRFDQD